ncbi:DUF4405 domain-containing protein [Gynuella sunshinyii]|uniref:DUF4405 domain-containing protein n=1 Tax=Gynuella sunshinyii YC6258 TaxID=1445510 RepID=A0A0C5V9E6_9GAMM|nr:DUF4405 domain-containing protein [Gynuella sunshinyii]AJQ95995.1 hypothetical Protein YC6258_03959 [Gynuella sunshinyii YC6258]
MKNWLLRYSTPLTTGLFLVSLISGIGLFFHVGPMSFHSMHEWVSMALIIPFILHIWRNWKGLLNHFKRSAMPLALAFSTLFAVAFMAWPSDENTTVRSGPPQFALAHTLTSASPATVAPIFGITADEMVTQLKAQGFDSASQETSLSDIASNSGKETSDLYAAMLGMIPASE